MSRIVLQLTVSDDKSYFRYSMSFNGGMTIKREEKESVPESLLCNGVGDVHDKLVGR